MAEGIPYVPGGSESYTSAPESEDKKKNKRKRKKRADGIGSLVTGASEKVEQKFEAKATPEKPKSLKGVLKLAETDPEQTKPDAQEETNAPADTTAEQYQHIDTRELRPNEFSGGEVIINLREAVAAQPAEQVPESTQDEAPELAAEELLDQSEAEDVTEDDWGEWTQAGSAGPAETVNAANVVAEAPEDTRATPQPTTSSPRPTAAASTPTSAQGGRPQAGGAAFGGGSGRPPTPIIFNQASPSPNPNSYTANPATPNVATAKLPEVQQLVDDAEYNGRRKGRSEGFWTGALLVGGYEHFKHRRREKRMEKKHSQEIGAQAKTIEDMRWDEIRKEQSEKWRAAEAAKYRRSEAAITAAGERPAQGEQAPEQKGAVVSPEQHAVEEQLKVPDGHRVEHSAWHTVEVDEHGRAVEDSVIEYGHEYYKERAKESTPIDQAQLKNVTGGVALTAAAMRDVDDDDESDEARVSRQNREFAAGQTKAGAKGGKSGALGVDSSAHDSFVSILPWVLALIVIGITIWALN